MDLMKRWYILLILFLFVFCSVFFIQSSYAQINKQANILRANAGEDRSVKVGSEIVFDASESYIPQDVQVIYKWDMGNNNFRFGVRPIFSYEEAGIYRVKLTIEAKDGSSFSVDESIVEVFEEQAIVVARSNDLHSSELYELRKKIQDSNIAVAEAYINKEFPSDFIAHHYLLEQLISLRNIVEKTDVIVVVDRFGAEVLLDYAQKFPEDLKNKKIGFLLTQGSIKSMHIDLAQLLLNNTPAKEVRMEYISALPDSFFQPTLQQAISFVALERGPRPHVSFTDMLYQFNSRLLTAGMSLDGIYLLYFVMLISVFGIALRKVLGIGVVGLHTLTLTLLAIFITGFPTAWFVFTLFFVLHYLMRRLNQTNYLTLLPSQFINIVIFFVVSIIGMFLIQNFYPDITFNMPLFMAFVVLAISANRLSLAVISDNFNIILLRYMQEIIFFLFNMFLVSTELFRMSIIMYPEMYLVGVVGIAILLDRYAGLRLTEYIRFQSVIREREE